MIRDTEDKARAREERQRALRTGIEPAPVLPLECRDCSKPTLKRERNLRCPPCSDAHRARARLLGAALAVPHTSAAHVLLEWSPVALPRAAGAAATGEMSPHSAAGWRVIALHEARTVRVLDQVVELARVRARSPLLDLDGLARDRGWHAKCAAVRGWEYSIRVAVLRRAAGLSSDLVGDDHDARLPAKVA